MAEPARKQDWGIEPDIAPDLRTIQGGGETTSDRGNLRAVNDQESNPEAPNKEGSVADQEAAPSNVIQGPWANNVSPFGGARGSSRGKLSGLKATLMKKGPLSAIAATVLGGGIVLTSFLGPASLLLNLKENFVNKFDTQNTSMTIRLNRVIVNKLTGDTTSGSCKVITIGCKFSRPSNNFLNKLADNGVVARNKAGDVIEKKLIGFNERPATYEFVDRNGKTISTDAKNFSKLLTENAEFRATFHKAFNPRFIGYADSVAQKILKRFSLDKSNKLTPDSDTNKTNETLNKESAGTPNAASEALDDLDRVSGTNTIINEALEEEIQHSARRLTKAGGDPIITIGTVACIGMNAPGFVSKVARAYQMRQLIKYGLVFLTVADAIKAGDATPNQVESLGKILTNVYKDDKGSVTNNSAMDSFGIKNGLFGDTNTTGFTKDFNTKVPGGSTAGFAPAAEFVSDPKVKETCSLIASPQAQVAALSAEAAITAATAGTGGVVIAALKVGFKGLIMVGALDVAVNTLQKSGFIGWVVGNIPTEKIMGMFMGDLTKNVEGEDSGNVVASGLEHYMGQTANGGANAPLTISQAIAYNHLSNDVRLAYAEEDRATLSPFDASSPNTLVGSIVSQMLPYYSKLSSGPGTLSFLGNMVGSAIGNIAGTANAASDANVEAGYRICSDTSISSTDVAAGPFCNIIYGIPPEYINEDTGAVVASMIDHKQIDETTGEPIENTDLANWLADCTTGTTEGVAGCTITDKETAEYALYFIDHRIQKDMDGEDTPATDAAAPAPSSAPSQGAGTPENVTDKGSGWTLTDGLDYSAIACAPGTKDEGIYTHPVRNFTIRKCAVAGDDVASIVTEKAAALFAAAKISGVNLTLESGFRSYEEQAKLYAENCNSAGKCRPATAKPGNSQHEAGIAFDINYNGFSICRPEPTANCHNNAGSEWLKANASKYGIFNLPLEAWHWSTSGT